MDNQGVTRSEYRLGQLSLHTVKLIEALRAGNVGDILTDEELARICGRDTKVGGEGYPNLQTAVKRCTKEHAVNWERVPGAACIKCINAKEARDRSQRTRRHIGRAAKRSVAELQAYSETAMENTERSEHLVALAQAGTLAVVADNRTTKKLEARNIANPLDLTKLLEVWKENK